MRVSTPFSVFDSRQIYDNQPLVWDDAQVSGAGTSSTYNADQASTTLTVAANTAGRRVRQTKQRFTYQPGKSQVIFMTGILGPPVAGITESIGWGDDNNGIFLRCVDGVLTITRRTSTSGAAVDNDVAQTAWNIDKMDGAGPSGVTINPQLTQIVAIDAEWLGVGRVRIGFLVDGVIVYVHEFLNSNEIALVYMSSSTLPLQYSIENDGTAPETSMLHICASVMSEGGQQEIGSLRHVSTAALSVNANAIGTYYAIVGLRQKAAQLDSVLKPVSVSLVSLTNDAFEWRLILNPAVAGTFNYADVVNSPAQVAIGDVATNPSPNTVTNGTVIDGGYGAQQSAAGKLVQNALYVGSTIAGVRDTVVLAVTPLAVNLDIAGGMVWRELV
jgi:hypothetical protein